MSEAYEMVSSVFRPLASAWERIDQTFSAISALAETKACWPWSSFHHLQVTGTDECVTTWEATISAIRSETEAQWRVEVELEHADGRCLVTASAGFQSKYGPADLRVIDPAVVENIEDLGSILEQVLNELFQDLDQDCRRAVEADLEEQKAWSKDKNETEPESTE